MPHVNQMPPSLQLGIVRLLKHHPDWIAGRRIALLSHPAAVDTDGTPTAELLRRSVGRRLVALMGPEHGFYGLGAAGESIRHERHPAWGIPIFSLYGPHRKPTAHLLRGTDAVLFDIQDIGARPYTYISTLRFLLEAAAEADVEVIVADRPVPLPCVADGPVLEPAFESFVGAAAVPMSYGMTPGESARWLRRNLRIPVKLRVARMMGYRRSSARGPGWPPWIPPSPGIRSWESAACYPATVFGEALPAVDIGRATNLAFQVIGSPWMNGDTVAERMNDLRFEGVRFHPHVYQPPEGHYAGQRFNGVRLTVTDGRAFRPVRTAVTLIAVLQRLYGKDRIWRHPGTRPEFFDKLFGTDSVRKALLDGESPKAIAKRWRLDLIRYRETRARVLLYPEP